MTDTLSAIQRPTQTQCNRSRLFFLNLIYEGPFIPYYLFSIPLGRKFSWVRSSDLVSGVTLRLGTRSIDFNEERGILSLWTLDLSVRGEREVSWNTLSSSPVTVIVFPGNNLDGKVRVTDVRGETE